jgi:hypothetical protein
LGDELRAETKFGRKLNFCHALMSAATRRSLFTPGEDEVLALTHQEKVLFPLAAGEVPLARYEGKVADDLGPCCAKKHTWHPGCCLACSCGVKPMFSNGAMTLTTQTLFGARTLFGLIAFLIEVVSSFCHFLLAHSQRVGVFLFLFCLLFSLPRKVQPAVWVLGPVPAAS